MSEKEKNEPLDPKIIMPQKSTLKSIPNIIKVANCDAQFSQFCPFFYLLWYFISHGVKYMCHYFQDMQRSLNESHHKIGKFSFYCEESIKRHLKNDK